MSSKGFTHLHLHSQYSLLDGTISFDKLFKLCKDLAMTSVALTDHGNMFAVILERIPRCHYGQKERSFLVWNLRLTFFMYFYFWERITPGFLDTKLAIIMQLFRIITSISSGLLAFYTCYPFSIAIK